MSVAITIGDPKYILYRPTKKYNVSLPVRSVEIGCVDFGWDAPVRWVPKIAITYPRSEIIIQNRAIICEKSMKFAKFDLNTGENIFAGVHCAKRVRDDINTSRCAL